MLATCKEKPKKKNDCDPKKNSHAKKYSTIGILLSLKLARKFCQPRDMRIYFYYLL